MRRAILATAYVNTSIFSSQRSRSKLRNSLGSVHNVTYIRVVFKVYTRKYLFKGLITTIIIL